MDAMILRAPVSADAPAVLSVFASRDRADLGVVVHTLEDLRDDWRASDVDLEDDARVVEVEGQIVAYAIVRRHGVLAVVAPDHEGLGIGAGLLDWAERRELEQGRAPHRQWVAAGNASARALLTAAGYGKARSYWRLRRPLDVLAGAPAAPAGVRLRPVDPVRDAAVLHALDAATFVGAPDYVPESLQEFREQHLEAHDTDPELSLAAEEDGRIVGFLIAARREPGRVGFVNLLAVGPDRQRRGIGTALLLAAFAGFAAAGLREAQLMVASDNPSALRVYERADMKLELQFDVYERTVDD
jgi:mycothiol synthase